MSKTRMPPLVTLTGLVIDSIHAPCGPLQFSLASLERPFISGDATKCIEKTFLLWERAGCAKETRNAGNSRGVLHVRGIVHPGLFMLSQIFGAFLPSGYIYLLRLTLKATPGTRSHNYLYPLPLQLLFTEIGHSPTLLLRALAPRPAARPPSTRECRKCMSGPFKCISRSRRHTSNRWSMGLSGSRRTPVPSLEFHHHQATIGTPIPVTQNSGW
jgi:hypothetical protein